MNTPQEREEIYRAISQVSGQTLKSIKDSVKLSTQESLDALIEFEVALADFRDFGNQWDFEDASKIAQAIQLMEVLRLAQDKVFYCIGQEYPNLQALLPDDRKKGWDEERGDKIMEGLVRTANTPERKQASEVARLLHEEYKRQSDPEIRAKLLMEIGRLLSDAL